MPMINNIKSPSPAVWGVLLAMLLPAALGCEQAFARGATDTTCITNADLNCNQLGSSVWGWSTPLSEQMKMQLWSGAASCDTSGATLIGSVAVSNCVLITASTAYNCSVLFNLEPGYSASSYRLWVGPTAAPASSSEDDCKTATELFNYKQAVPSQGCSGSTCTTSITVGSADISSWHIITQVDVCPSQPQQQAAGDDPDTSTDAQSSTTATTSTQTDIEPSSDSMPAAQPSCQSMHGISAGGGTAASTCWQQPAFTCQPLDSTSSPGWSTPLSTTAQLELHSSTQQCARPTGPAAGTVTVRDCTLRPNGWVCDVHYRLLPGYSATAYHLWIGGSALPLTAQDNATTCMTDLSYFNYQPDLQQQGGTCGATSCTINVFIAAQDISSWYVAAHATVCGGGSGGEPQAQPADGHSDQQQQQQQQPATTGAAVVDRAAAAVAIVRRLLFARLPAGSSTGTGAAAAVSAARSKSLCRSRRLL